ncbi:hypothetical protein BaRGS_00030432 [Batillaria attramentaria]|uniref:Uncharacterized protein n=1 Tax=Batillaria attramentaria TaxID=370345 RepID=A0ABD0JT53_9CAEN
MLAVLWLPGVVGAAPLPPPPTLSPLFCPLQNPTSPLLPLPHDPILYPPPFRDPSNVSIANACSFVVMPGAGENIPEHFGGWYSRREAPVHSVTPVLIVFAVSRDLDLVDNYHWHNTPHRKPRPQYEADQNPMGRSSAESTSLRPPLTTQEIVPTMFAQETDLLGCRAPITSPEELSTVLQRGDTVYSVFAARFDVGDGECGSF